MCPILACCCRRSAARAIRRATMRRLNAILLSVAFAVSARASVTITVDRLDPSDGGSQPPAGIVVVDVLVDVQAADRWTIGGFRGEALGGASLIYAIDPETGQPRPTNPGVDHRFVSFVSQPRPRDADARFNDSGATVGGSFCNGGSAPTLTPLEFNIDWMPTMPPPPGMDGAIVRVALDVSTVCQGQNAIVVVGAPPPTVVTLFRSMCV